MNFFRMTALVLLTTLAGVSHFSYGAECESPARLRFSVIPNGNMQKELLALKPLFDDLQKSLGIPVEVAMPSSYGAVIEGLLSGDIDLARLGPAAYVSARKQDAGIIPFASPSRTTSAQHNGQDFYYSVLVVRKDSPFPTIDSLRGKRILLVDPDSTSGGLVPRHVFAHFIHLPIEQFFGQTGYSGSHDRSISNLIKGQTDAVFVSSLALREDEIKPADSPYRVLWRSKPIPRDPFVLRERLCANIKKKIIAVFLPADGNPSSTLMHNLNATHFFPVRDEDFQMLRELP